MKYSALILFVTLAVSWSSADAIYNKYQDDVINSMTKWALEETSNIPEPYKTRVADKINGAKNQHWNSVGDYFKQLSVNMQEIVVEILTERSKRSVDHLGFAHTPWFPRNLQQISEVFAE